MGQTKKDFKLFEKIYSAILDDFKENPTNFVIVDSTTNNAIDKTDYSTYMSYFSVPARKGYSAEFILDSSWIHFLKEVEVKRQGLMPFPLPKIKSIHSLKKVKRNTISNALKSNANSWTGFYNTFANTKGWIELSNVILSKNRDKAIVELNHHGDSRTGAGNIYFLEKRKQKWVVVNSMQTWIA